jgi:sortase (surface protein transpeptidase)
MTAVTRRRNPARPRLRVAVVLALLTLATAGCGGGQASPAPPVAHAPKTSPSAAVNATATPTATSRPVRVAIPAIGVDSPLIDLGLQADGSLQVPATGFPAGWFTGGPVPGEPGPAVLAGHVDWGGSPGVFYRLRDVVAGDLITVTRKDASTVAFRVSRVAKFAKNAFPTKAVYGDLDHAGLRVITCGGAFDHRARSYVDNIVVFADRVATPRS